MEMIHVYARPNDLDKLGKRVAPFRPPGFIGCQVAGNNVWRIWPRYLTKIIPATQIRRRIDLRRLLAKVWVSTREEFGRGVFGVAAIAVSLCIYNITAQSHQGQVLSVQVQRDRRNLESLLNPRIGVVASVLVPSARRIEHYSGHGVSVKRHAASQAF